MSTDAMLDQMREALVIARAGLVWYQEHYPETFSECDNEALEQIDAALASQAKQPTIDQLKMIEIQDVLEALDADKTEGELVNGNFDDNTLVELPNLSHDAAKVIRFLLQSQAQKAPNTCGAF